MGAPARCFRKNSRTERLYGTFTRGLSAMLSHGCSGTVLSQKLPRGSLTRRLCHGRTPAGRKTPAADPVREFRPSLSPPKQIINKKDPALCRAEHSAGSVLRAGTDNAGDALPWFGCLGEQNRERFARMPSRYADCLRHMNFPDGCHRCAPEEASPDTGREASEGRREPPEGEYRKGARQISKR